MSLLQSEKVDQSAHVMPEYHVPPQRREVASEANRGLRASRPLTLRRTSRQASHQTSRSLNYARHLLHCTEAS
jgi:hypothetical protein